MKLLKHSSIIILMFYMPFCFAQEGVKHEFEHKLIGAWQEGLTEKIRGMQDQRIKNILLRNVIAFEADNTFQIYPRCGKESAEFKTKGIVSIGGKWFLDKSGTLHFTVEHKENKKTMEMVLAIHFDEDNLVISKWDTKPRTIFGRYSHSLPPHCPS